MTVSGDSDGCGAINVARGSSRSACGAEADCGSGAVLPPRMVGSDLPSVCVGFLRLSGSSASGMINVGSVDSAGGVISSWLSLLTPIGSLRVSVGSLAVEFVETEVSSSASSGLASASGSGTMVESAFFCRASATWRRTSTKHTGHSVSPLTTSISVRQFLQSIVNIEF